MDYKQVKERVVREKGSLKKIVFQTGICWLVLILIAVLVY